jgi:hypothetical protein
VYIERLLILAEAKEVIAIQIENELRGFNVKHRLFYEADLLDYCPSLVIVVRTTRNELYLAHFSVKEYLLIENKFDIISVSSSITSMCLMYLTDIKGSYQRIQEDFPMARYAAEIWMYYTAFT